MMAGLAYVAHGGTYVLVSVVRDTISFADPSFHKRERRSWAAATRRQRTSPRSSTRCATVACRRNSLITHRVALEEAPGGFPLWIKPEAGVIKALIEI